MTLMKVLRTLVVVLSLSVSGLTWAETVWIDVRSEAEYQRDHIDGDSLIPHTMIVGKVQKLYPDKDTEIYLYCRSGGRAGMAKAALNEAGYPAVFNAGGIDEARAARGLSSDY